MKITLELDYDEAMALRERISCEFITPQTACLLEAVREDICAVLASAIDNQDERRGQGYIERLAEYGGVDDSKRRQDMKDAGRGHLLK
jgi:hypothetical protein